MSKKKRYVVGEPRVEFYDFMDHHFIFADRYNIRIYECSKCNMEAFIKIENGYLEQINLFTTSKSFYFMYFDYGYSNKYIERGSYINCEEYIIKNIIE